jgi:hypothetical protein
MFQQILFLGKSEVEQLNAYRVSAQIWFVHDEILCYEVNSINLKFATQDIENK